MHTSSQSQAEIIADKFAYISDQYKPLKLEEIYVSSMEDSKPFPLFESYQVYEKIKKMKNKTSTSLNDIP